MALLSEADRALGRLDGAVSVLPDPDLFVLQYVRREAVLSSQIEGTHASLMDVLEFEAEHVTAIFTGFGERGRPAEDVAWEAIEAARPWLAAQVPVDEYLADQLLLPMALARNGSFRTTKPSLHSTTNATIIQRFLPVPIRFEQESDLIWRVTVGKG